MLAAIVRDRALDDRACRAGRFSQNFEYGADGDEEPPASKALVDHRCLAFPPLCDPDRHRRAVSLLTGAGEPYAVARSRCAGGRINGQQVEPVNRRRVIGPARRRRIPPDGVADRERLGHVVGSLRAAVRYVAKCQEGRPQRDRVHREAAAVLRLPVPEVIRDRIDMARSNRPVFRCRTRIVVRCRRGAPPPPTRSAGTD